MKCLKLEFKNRSQIYCKEILLSCLLGFCLIPLSGHADKQNHFVYNSVDTELAVLEKKLNERCFEAKLLFSKMLFFKKIILKCFAYKSPKYPGIIVPVVILSKSPRFFWLDFNEKYKKKRALIFLSGGPGQGGVTNADNIAFWMNKYVSMDLDDDIILYGMPGTYSTLPKIADNKKCQGYHNLTIDILSQSMSLEDEIVLTDKYLLSCFDYISEYYREIFSSVDGTNNIKVFSSHFQAIFALNMMRQLGYDVVNVLAVSYGTRVGLLMADNPLVDKLILDSVYPFSRGDSYEWLKSEKRLIDFFVSLHQLFLANTNENINAFESKKKLFTVLKQLDKEPIIISSLGEKNEKKLLLNAQRMLLLIQNASYDSSSWWYLMQAFEGLYKNKSKLLQGFEQENVHSTTVGNAVKNFTDEVIEQYVALKYLTELTMFSIEDKTFSPVLFFLTQCIDNQPADENKWLKLYSYYKEKEYIYSDLGFVLENNVCAHSLISANFQKNVSKSIDEKAQKNERNEKITKTNVRFNYVQHRSYAKIRNKVLILAGDRDVPTPFEWAENLYKKLENAQLVVGHNTGHSVLFHESCDWSIISEFINNQKVLSKTLQSHCNPKMPLWGELTN